MALASGHLGGLFGISAATKRLKVGLPGAFEWFPQSRWLIAYVRDR